jgi:arylsulfatase B
MNKTSALSAALLPLFVLPAALDAKVRKPNVVLIVADDLGWGDVGYHGSVIRTPNIDRLASEGIELDRYYSAPISSPARAGLLTGRYPSRFGFRESVIPPWRDCGLDAGERTLADLLVENGYAHRAAIGKWHLGHTHLCHYPLNRGFDHFYGCLNGALDYFTHIRNDELDWHNDWDSSYDEGYTTDLIAQEASRCVEAYAREGQPFFLYVAFNAPHAPYLAPDDAIAEYIDPAKLDAMGKKERNAWVYRAMVSRLDRGIGQILDRLDEQGLSDDTLVIFVSDNGGVEGLTGGSTCLPLRGHKFQEWDGGVRVPAVLRWPGHFPGGRKIEEVTAFVDLMPTLAQLVGDRKKTDRPYDGISILRLLEGRKKALKRDLYLGCGAVVNREGKYIRAGKNKAMPLKEDWYSAYADDPYESRNALPAHQKEAGRLKAIADRYDAIVPYVPEQEYGKGMKGFKAPKEWKVTLP